MQAYIWGPHIAVRLIWRCGYGTRCEWINDTNIWKNINNLGHPKWWTPCSVITYDTWQHDASWGRKRAGKYKLLLKRKQLTLTAWLESVNTLPDGRGGGGGGHRFCQKNESLITALNTRTTTDNKYYLTRTKHNCTSSQYILKWNISVNGHKQRPFGFSQNKQLTRSAANSTVTICIYQEYNASYSARL